MDKTPRSPQRVLRTKLLFASTIEELEEFFESFLEAVNICVGNYVDLKLWKLGNIYQLALIYAVVI